MLWTYFPTLVALFPTRSNWTLFPSGRFFLVDVISVDVYSIYGRFFRGPIFRGPFFQTTTSYHASAAIVGVST